MLPLALKNPSEPPIRSNLHDLRFLRSQDLFELLDTGSSQLLDFSLVGMEPVVSDLFVLV